MKFNEKKCNALNLGRNNLMHQDTPGANLLKSSSVEKDLRALPDPELNPSHCCAPACPGLVRFRDGILPSALVRPWPGYCVQLWAPHYESHGHTMKSPAKNCRDDGGTEASPLRKGWRSWHCCLLKGRLGGVVNVEQYLPRGGVKTEPGSSQ